MNKLNIVKKLILFLIIFTSIFSLCNFVHADQSTFESAIKKWLDNGRNWPYELNRYKYKGGDKNTNYGYVMRMPELFNDYPIVVDNDGTYYYQEKNGNNYENSKPLRITVKAEIQPGKYITSSTMIATSQGANLVYAYFPQIAKEQEHNDWLIITQSPQIDGGTEVLWNGNQRIWDRVAQKNDSGAFRDDNGHSYDSTRKLLITVETTDGSYSLTDYEPSRRISKSFY